MSKSHELSNFIWSIADLLRGPYRPPQYERVMLPLVVLRRFDCVLKPTKQAVLEKFVKIGEKHYGEARDGIL
ncbi:MAG: type I restriction-modification system subunit M N-terminal domain-containing protein, partial [Hydrogenophaga sp.]|nr:type I restriction-modification system subunit M N-terminal domain-containing protein [Hydrogenophaga sp.]